MVTSLAAALKRTYITDASTPSETVALLLPLDRIAAWTWQRKWLYHLGLSPLRTTYISLYISLCVLVCYNYSSAYDFTWEKALLRTESTLERIMPRARDCQTWKFQDYCTSKQIILEEVSHNSKGCKLLDFTQSIALQNINIRITCVPEVVGTWASKHWILHTVNCFQHT